MPDPESESEPEPVPEPWRVCAVCQLTHCACRPLVVGGVLAF